MSLLQRLRRSLTAGPAPSDEAARLLAQAESLLRQGADRDHIRSLARAALDMLDTAATGDAPDPEDPLRRAAALTWLGELDDALPLAYAAAAERPYDVDSRIVHGNLRLARNELDQAAHEFDAVIEEFGADADAADGRRAVILARGHAPADELPAHPDDWRRAAILLTSLWRQANQIAPRLDALADAHPDTLALLRHAASQPID